MNELHELAGSYGIEVAYEDATGERREASPESVLAVLPALGAPVAGPKDVAGALRERRQQVWKRPVEPVVVAWDGGPAVIDLRLPEKQASGSFVCTLRLESGEERRWTVAAGRGGAEKGGAGEGEGATVEGVTYATVRVTLPERVPDGYHTLAVELPTGRHEALLIAAPTRAYAPSGRGWERSWGVFLPLYSLHSKRSLGAGDFADLEDLAAWARGLGGGLVGTLPLMPAFLDEPYEISPYSPVSRLFWNEFYLAVDRVPEVVASEDARKLLESSEFAAERESLRTADLVDYRRTGRLKRRVLEEAAKTFFSAGSARRAEFDRYVAGHPHAEDYAAFRAVGERLRQPWSEWPEGLREGKVAPGDYDAVARDYHLFAQWLCDEQLGAVAEKARSGGPGLYLDLPLGVNAGGYDTWRERRSFAAGVAGGAPPDPMFPRGQNWGFVPLHPEGVRETGYRYVRAFVRNLLRFAGVLRIDHMPSFHRVFWIPPGHDATRGVFVRYPSEELYAVFCLESHRHRTVMVGEDLGTVPPEVPVAMARHNFHRMSVVQYELKPDAAAALADPPAASLACVNTHDMPPFASYWEGRDIADRRKHGFIDDAAVEREEAAKRQVREALIRFLRVPGAVPGAAHMLRALLESLRDGPARLLLVNLEDLWSEVEPQNVPSTAGEESPNWRRKARYSFEEFARMPEVLDLLGVVERGFEVIGKNPG